MSRNRYHIMGTNMKALATAFILCVWAFCFALHQHTMCMPGTAEIRGGCPSPWNWTCSWFPLTMWVVGGGPESSARASVL